MAPRRNDQRYDTTAALLEQREVLADLGRRAVECDDFDVLLDDALRSVAAALDADCAEVLRVAPEEGTLYLEAGVGWSEERFGRAIASRGDGSQLASTLLTDEPVIVEDLGEDARFEGSELLTSRGVRSGVTAVVGPADDPWGMLGVHATDRRAFTDADADLVRSAASLLAMASERARRRGATGRSRSEGAIAERNERERTLTALHEATRELMVASAKRDICEIAVKTAKRVLDLPITAVHVLDEDERALEPVASTPEARELFGTIPTFERGEGLAWRVFEEGEPRLYEDVRAEPATYNPDTPVRTEIIVPVGEHGILTSGSLSLRDLDEFDLEFINVLAANTEAALERAERERDLHRHRRIIDAVGDGIYQLDGDGYLVSVNENIVEKTGYSREELIGKHVSAVLDEEAIDRCLRVIYDLMECDETDVGATDIEVETAEGETLTCEVRIALLRSAEGFQGSVGVLRDVTERKRREREIERQRDELTRLNRINAAIRDINQMLVSAETRGEVERGVCERLAASDMYLAAWFGEPNRHTEELVPRASAGPIDDYLDTVTVRVDDTPAGRGPAGKVLRSGEVQVVDDVERDPAFEPWADVVARYGIESIASIPIAYEHNRYGVLSVYADHPHAFDAEERSVLREFGETIGLAINAVEQRKALVSEHITELEFALPDGLAPLIEATRGGEPTITVERTVATGESYVQFFTVDGLTPERFRAATERIERVTDVRRLGHTDEGCFFEVGLSSVPFQETVASYGGHVPSMTIENGRLRARVELPRTVDTRRVVETVTDRFPGADLLSQRSTARKPHSLVEYRSFTEERLTAKQRAALELAYFSGYFDWPRGTTGEEVAESLGISPSTFAQHLRVAERKVFDALLADDPTISV